MYCTVVSVQRKKYRKRGKEYTSYIIQVHVPKEIIEEYGIKKMKICFVGERMYGEPIYCEEEC